MMKKQRGNILLLIACVLSYLMVAMAFVLFVFFAFNILGVSDVYIDTISNLSGTRVDANDQITMLCIELAVMALVDLYFASFYLKGYRYRLNSKQYGRMLISQGLFQMLLATFLPGLFALICGIRMYRKKPKNIDVQVEEKPDFMSNYKLEAMSEAVSRLKELKEKGAISEEEYYATLNKILES